mgnify:CR=1 FL=1
MKKQHTKEFLYNYGWIALILIGIIVILFAGREFIGKATNYNLGCNSGIKGDLNDDSIIDEKDLDIIITLKDSPVDGNICCADLNVDKRVDNIDYELLFDAFLDNKDLGVCK